MSAPIVVGYDGTETAGAALAEAVRLAQALDAELVIVHAIRVNPMGGEVADLAAALDEQARAVLADGQQRAGIPSRAVIARGRVRDALTEVAASEGAQMIVVGPTPFRLLAKATVPVLSVP